MKNKYSLNYASDSQSAVAVYKDGLELSSQSVVDELNSLRGALREAHHVILHEMDNGRTPYMLKAENGGKGLGYFEDVLGGVKRQD